uniref:(northern house mosquito) hypothetical protein n=1 Tax=Culex pipiens TaxID=7175 RepID=A0A8D8MM46_CULPI
MRKYRLLDKSGGCSYHKLQANEKQRQAGTVQHPGTNEGHGCVLSGIRVALRQARGQSQPGRPLHYRNLLSKSQLGRAAEWRSLANFPRGLQRPRRGHRARLRPDSVLLVGPAEPARGATGPPDAVRHHAVVPGRGRARVGPAALPAGLRKQVQCLKEGETHTQ